MCSRGLSIPGDLLLVGFDNVPEAVSYIEAAYFQQAAQKEAVLFDELWSYNDPNVDVVTADRQ